MEKTSISPSGSMKGYNFWVAVARNKEALKLVVAALGSFTTFLTITGFDWKAFIIAVIIAIAGFAVKMAQDAIDFGSTNVELNKK